jgi:hypothetical protein
MQFPPLKLLNNSISYFVINHNIFISKLLTEILLKTKNKSIFFSVNFKIRNNCKSQKSVQKRKTAPSASRGKGYPFPRLLVFPQTPNVNFFEIYKTPLAWLFLFL